VVRNMNVVYFVYYNTFILNIFYIRTGEVKEGEGSPWHREEAAKGQGCGGHQRGDGGDQTYVRRHEGGGGG
jgi:hypothetical protein